MIFNRKNYVRSKKKGIHKNYCSTKQKLRRCALRFILTLCEGVALRYLWGGGGGCVAAAENMCNSMIYIEVKVIMENYLAIFK